MKKIIALSCITILFSYEVYSQKSKTEIVVPEMPLNENTNLISFRGKHTVAESYKELLYNRALDWANTYYKNPGDVIREKDLAAGRIVIKARFRISNEPDKEGTITNAGNVIYTLTIEFKDNKYRYEFTSLTWLLKSAFPAERWMDTTSPTFTLAYPYYLKQSRETITETEASLNNAMGTSIAPVEDDW